MAQFLSTTFLYRTLAFLAMLWFSGYSLLAQCSQCKAAAASEDAQGNLMIGAKMNTGVLYLLALPVLLPFVVGGIWYIRVRQQRKAQGLEGV